MSEENSRRNFLKTVFVASGGIAALFTKVTFDTSDGVKIGNKTIRVGISEAYAACGTAFNCSGS